MINDEFGRHLLTTFNDPKAHGVHLLFNQWWAHAPEHVKRSYVDGILADPVHRAWVEEGWFAEPLDAGALASCPEGSLGRAYHDWIVGNGLMASLATSYGQLHNALEAKGDLDGMPPEMRFLVLRGFQTHDFHHVVTGYDSSGRGEIALQAFGLAQIAAPYFGMWMSVVTTRMTFCDPRAITPMMDAITDGWQAGRSAPSIQAVRWEEQLDRPLADVRAELGIQLSPLARRGGQQSRALVDR